MTFDEEKSDPTYVTPFPRDKRYPSGLSILSILFALIFLVMMALIFLGCGSVDRDLQTLNSIERAQIATVEAFDKFDHDYGMSIVEQHRKEGKEATQAAWLKYDAVRERFKQLILSSKIVATTAKAILPLIEDGQRNRRDLDQLLIKLAAIGADMLALVQSLGVPAGGVQ